MSSISPVGSVVRHAPEPVIVKNWPLRDDRLWSGLIACGIFAIAAFSAAQVQNWAMGAIVLAGLGLAAWRLWVPVTFVMNSKGVTQTFVRRTRRLPWSQFARYQVYEGGVLLLADEQRTFLAPLNGIFVHWNGQRAEILHVLAYYLDQPPATAGSTESFSR